MKVLKDGAMTRQAANFYSLIEMATNLGADFKPVKEPLKLDKLNTLHSNVVKAIADWSQAETALQRATSLRKDAFDKLNSFVTLIHREVKIAGIEGEVKDDIELTLKQIRGSKKVSKASEDLPLENNAEAKTTYKNASIQRKLDVFTKLVEILGDTPEYESSYADLKIQGLKDKVTELNTLQQNYLSAILTLQGARAKRDTLLDDPNTGMIKIGQLLKEFFKIYYKDSKTQLKTLSSIKMTKRKN